MTLEQASTPPWHFWTGKRRRNTQTGEIFIATTTREWATRFAVFKRHHAAGCPSPMPSGHLMFGDKLALYEEA